MNQEFLKGNMVNISMNDKYTNMRGVQKKPLKLIPILRYKKI